MSIIQRAIEFATEKHKNQKRKYTGEPYINHCLSVRKILREHVRNLTTDMECAAILHDTLEDTNTTREELYREFGAGVMVLVHWLTDISTKKDGNRDVRKAIDRAHLAKSPAAAQTIKLADLIDNTDSIVEQDPDFARTYMWEKKKLLEVLRKGNKRLHKIACEKVENYESAYTFLSTSRHRS